MVTLDKPHEIWREQCQAARGIADRHGFDAALDYLISEKLINYAEAASRHPEFARALPTFVAEVRHIFTAEVLRTHLTRMERRLAQEAAASAGEDQDEDPFAPSPLEISQQRERFALLKSLLTEPLLGTS